MVAFGCPRIFPIAAAMFMRVASSVPDLRLGDSTASRAKRHEKSVLRGFLKARLNQFKIRFGKGPPPRRGRGRIPKGQLALVAAPAATLDAATTVEKPCTSTARRTASGTTGRATGLATGIA